MKYESGNTSLHVYYLMHYYFQESHSIICYQVTNIEGIFNDAMSFKPDVSLWQTSQVIPLYT